MPRPVVAIVGRPNVGKSSLYNRILGRREAIVSDVAGTTRDRIVAPATWQEREFLLVDTGGLEPEPQDRLRNEVKAQVELAAQEADVIILVLDAMDGLTPVDQEISGWVRKLSKPVVVAANKVDNVGRSLFATEFYQLGLGEPMPISAYHNTGIYELLDEVVKRLPESPSEPAPPPGIPTFAIIGRPNVGKSALLNAILEQPRAIVSEVPGTTRDSLDTPFTYKGQSMVLIDTAGIRRRGSVETGIEQYAVLRAYRALDRADTAIVVLDAAEGPTAQDAHVAGTAYELHKGIVLAVNKWDLALEREATPEEVTTQVRRVLHFVPYAPIRFTSALKGEGVKEALETAIEVWKERSTRVPELALRRAVQHALGSHPPPTPPRGRWLKFGRTLQVDTNPPTFAFTVNDPDLVHFSYQRYLENQLREAFGFKYTHLRLVFKRRETD